jgi:hypothetical protein
MFAMGCFSAGIALASETQEFSRSEQIARWMDRVQFSGGVLPATGAPADLANVHVEPLASRVDKSARKPVRVNRDLLGMETTQQPGYQAEPYIHADPFDPEHLVAGWQENRFMDGGAQALNVAVSFDGGKTWEESILPGLTRVNGGPWEAASDPWVEFGPDNRVYFSSLLFNKTTPDNAIGVSTSTDGGLSWGDPVEVFRSFFDFNDKEAVTVDTYPGSPYFGRVYVAWDINLTDATGQNFVGQRLVVARSRPNGSFTKPRRVRRGATNIGAVPRVGPDGTVYVIWSGNPAGDVSGNRLLLYFSRSRNGGRKWSRPRTIAALMPAGVANVRGGAIIPSFAIDPVSGDLYVAWSDGRWTGADKSTLVVSRDGGTTWSLPQNVSGAPAGAPTFTTTVAVNRRREVAVGYYSLENDPSLANLVDRYVVLSKDGGQSFGPPIRATRRSFDIRLAALAGGSFFLGDYVGLTGADRHFHLLWVGTKRRSPILRVRQPDVFTSMTR